MDTGRDYKALLELKKRLRKEKRRLARAKKNINNSRNKIDILNYHLKLAYRDHQVVLRKISKLKGSWQQVKSIPVQGQEAVQERFKVHLEFNIKWHQYRAVCTQLEKYIGNLEGKINSILGWITPKEDSTDFVWNLAYLATRKNTDSNESDKESEGSGPRFGKIVESTHTAGFTTYKVRSLQI